MLIATLLAGAALQVAAAPPPAPAPHGSLDAEGRSVTIITRDEADPHAAAFGKGGAGDHVLHFKDPEGRDVTVITDKVVTQADAEAMERDMRARIPEITAKALAEARAARANAETYRQEARRYGEDARRQGEEARREGDVARKEGEKAREYAQVIVKSMKDKGGVWAFDGGPDIAMFRHGDFAGPADLKALRDEVHELRDEVAALRAQLKSGGVTH